MEGIFQIGKVRPTNHWELHFLSAGLCLKRTHGVQHLYLKHFDRLSFFPPHSLLFDQWVGLPRRVRWLRLGFGPELEEVVSPLTLQRAGLPGHREDRPLMQLMRTETPAVKQRKKSIFYHFSNLGWLPKEKLSFQISRIAVWRGLNQRPPNPTIWLKPEKFSLQAT